LFVSFRQFATSCAPFDRGESAHMPPSIAASHESIPHRQARRVWNIPENHTWPLGAGRTAGEIRGKSIVWTARVFTGAPKFVEKSQKQIRSPFLVPLALLDLFSTSFVFSQRGAPIACRKTPARCLSCSDNRSLPQGYQPCARADGNR
jgi:hypothetical protein